MKKSLLLGLAAFSITACTSLADPQDVANLKASSEDLISGKIVNESCTSLGERRASLSGMITATNVQPKSINYTNAAELPKAKDLSAGQHASSVAKTALSSTIPGAGLLPVLTGSAKKQAAQAEALQQGESALAYIDGVMAAKGCDPIILASADAMPVQPPTEQKQETEDAQNSADKETVQPLGNEAVVEPVDEAPEAVEERRKMEEEAARENKAQRDAKVDNVVPYEVDAVEAKPVNYKPTEEDIDSWEK